MIEHRCPQCHHYLRIPNQFAGKPGKCKYCQAVFEVPHGPILPDPPPGTRGEPQRERPPAPIPVSNPGPPFQSLADELDHMDSPSSGFPGAEDLSFEPASAAQPRQAFTKGGADGILGTEIAGRHFSVWLIGLGLLVGVLGLPIGGQLAAAGVVYYLNFARDVEESWLFNKFTAPVWAVLAFITIPLAILSALLETAVGTTYIDQVNEIAYTVQYASETFEQVAADPEAQLAPPAEQIPNVVPLPPGAARYAALVPINLLLTALNATLGMALSWVSIAISFVLTAAFMFPFYLLKQLCEMIGDTGGVIIYVLLMICSGTIFFFLWGYVALLIMFWLGRRLLDLWGHNGEWGLGWHGFIYPSD